MDEPAFPVFFVRQQELDVVVVGLERDVLGVAEGLGEDFLKGASVIMLSFLRP
jgi:hypothetical protein